MFVREEGTKVEDSNNYFPDKSNAIRTIYRANYPFESKLTSDSDFFKSLEGNEITRIFFFNSFQSKLNI